MKLQTVALATVAALSAVAPAMAGESYATNSYSTRNIYNGYSQTKVQANISDVSQYSEYSAALKAESYAGDRNFASVNFDGKNFSGYAYSDNQRPQDPVAKIGYSEQTITGTRTEVAKVNTFSKYNFSGRDHSTTLTVGSNR